MPLLNNPNFGAVSTEVNLRLQKVYAQERKSCLFF